MDGPPIHNGAVRVGGTRVIEVGSFTDLSPSEGDVIDLGESILLPGLINGHCHLDYTCFHGKIPRPTSFTDWIHSINREKTKLKPDDYAKSIEQGLGEAQRYGTTSLVNLEAFPNLIDRIRSHSLRVWWCAELIDVTAPGRAQELIAAAQRHFQRGNNKHNFGLAPHAPFTASEKLYRACMEAARRNPLLLTTHLAESSEEMEMFRRRKGPLYQFLCSIGRPDNDCGGATPLALFLQKVDEWQHAAESNSTSGDFCPWLIAHLNELEESDFELLATVAKHFSVVHCPRSHAYFRHNPFPLEKLRGLGVNICLGTDSLASNVDLSLFAEMRQLKRNDPGFPSGAILEMVTVNASKAIGAGDRLGKIQAGYEADLIAIPGQPGGIYDSIINFNGPVPWMMIGGELGNFSRFPLFFSQT